MKESNIDWEWLFSLLQKVDDSVVAQAMGILPTNDNDCDKRAFVRCEIETEGDTKILEYGVNYAEINDLDISIYWLFTDEGGVVFDSVKINPHTIDSDDALISYAFGYLSRGYGRKSIKDFEYLFDSDINGGDHEWEKYSWKISS